MSLNVLQECYRVDHLASRIYVRQILVELMELAVKYVINGSIDIVERVEEKKEMTFLKKNTIIVRTRKISFSKTRDH